MHKEQGRMRGDSAPEAIQVLVRTFCVSCMSTFSGCVLTYPTHDLSCCCFQATSKEIMIDRKHGTCIGRVQSPLRWGCDWDEVSQSSTAHLRVSSLTIFACTTGRQDLLF